jgi:signal transduction histidine kinase
MKLRFRSLRTRLTVLYTTIFAFVLAIYILGGTGLHYYQLRDQLYHAEIQDSETVEGLLYATPTGELRLNMDYHSRPEGRLLLNRYMQVMSSDGTVLFRNERLKGCDLGGAPQPGEFSRTKFVARHIVLCDGVDVLSVSHTHLMNGRPLLIRVGYSMEPLHTRVVDFIGTLALGLPFAILLGGVAGFRVTTTSLKRLHKITTVTNGITAKRLGERFPVDDTVDELGNLAHAMNGLLQRLERSFEGLKHFTSEVSHELRTPLSSLRIVAEVGLHGQQTPDQCRETISSMLEEVVKLSSMVDMLLTIAHGETGSVVLQESSFLAEELLQETVGVVSLLADEKDQKILLASGPRVELFADRVFMRMVLINLLNNAVKYSPQSSRIFVSWKTLPASQANSPRVEICVADEGPGIKEHERERIFERFYRSKESGRDETGGTGLGLAIAKWAVQAHGGEIALETRDGGGSLFRVLLPLRVESGMERDLAGIGTKKTALASIPAGSGSAS